MTPSSVGSAGVYQKAFQSSASERAEIGQVADDGTQCASHRNTPSGSSS